MAKTELGKSFVLPCGVTVANRLVKAAMTENIADPATNRPNEKHITLYRRWGETKAGILITGNVMVDDRYMEAPGNVVMQSEEDLPVFKQWAEQSQKHGSQCWVQLSHVGRQCPRSINWHPVAPSAVPATNVGLPVFSAPRALTTAEIHEIIERFVKAAAIAKKAGFQGIQLHAAHGYLLSQFLSPLTNLRTDEFGGSLANRASVLRQVIKRVRDTVGKAYPIGVKLNSADFQKGGFSEEDSIQVLKWLEADGVDLVEISGGNYDSPQMMREAKRDSTRHREAFFLDFAQKARAATTMPLMLTGGFRWRAGMEKALTEKVIDFVGVARPFVTDLANVPRLLAGEVDEIKSVELSVGLKVLDTGLQALWYDEQIDFLSQGLDINPNRTRLRALLVGPIFQYLYNPYRNPGTWKAVLGAIVAGTSLAFYLLGK